MSDASSSPSRTAVTTIKFRGGVPVVVHYNSPTKTWTGIHGDEGFGAKGLPFPERPPSPERDPYDLHLSGRLSPRGPVARSRAGSTSPPARDRRESVSPSRSPVRALASPQRRGSHREKLEALLVVDMQRDFLPGGSLAIDGADRLIPVINSLHDLPRWAMVVFVQDWHPADHCSFASNQNGVPFTDVDLVVDGKTIRQTLWPDHCVQNTPGAELHPDLVVARHDRHLRKGTNRNYDSYSGFKDNCGNEPTGLEALLKDHNITDVFVVGVATEFCVAFTALHALEAGFATTVIVDACQAIEQDVADKLLQRYRRRGGKVAYAQDVQGEPPGLHI